MVSGVRYAGPVFDFTKAGLANSQTISDPLFQWRRNFAKRNSRSISVALLGDSVPFGQGLTVGTTPDRTNYMDHMTIQLQRILNGVASYGQRNWVDDALATVTTFPWATGGGYCIRPAHCQLGGFADPWKLVSGTVTYLARGMGLKCLQLNAASRISYTAESSDGFMWWYETGASQLGTLATTVYAGDYSASPTGVYNLNVSNPTNTGLAQYARSFTAWASLPRGKWTIEFSPASGTPVLDMMYVLDGDLARGVKVYNYSYGAKSSGDYAANNTEANTSATAATVLSGFDSGQGVDLCIYYIGANDYANNIVPAAFQTNLETAIDKYRAAQTRPMAFLLVSHFARYDVTTPTYAWPLYKAAMKAVTKTRTQTDYLDLGDYFPTSQANDTDDDLVDSTGVHLTNHGQGLAAQLIAQKLMFPAVM